MVLTMLLFAYTKSKILSSHHSSIFIFIFVGYVCIFCCISWIVICISSTIPLGIISIFIAIVSDYNDHVDLPFVLTKNECVIWAYADVQVDEMVTHKEYVGRTSGASIRIAKGVYWRIGACKGIPIEKSAFKSLGDAIVAITSKNLFFTIRGMDSVKIPLSKIVSIYPYSNGVLVVQDGKRKSPLFFHVDDDSWFFANALKNASNID